MNSLTPQFLHSLTLTVQQVNSLTRISTSQGRQELFEQQAPEILGTLRQAALIESTESSNRLEGISAPVQNIRNMVLRDAAPLNRSEQEIAGYRDALSLIHESARDMPFSANVVRQIHKMIYRYLPQGGGEWKQADNNIIERNPDGSIERIRFQPVSAVQTEQAMIDLVTRYAESKAQDIPSLIRIPLAILDFLCIHPFTDGNERTARLLTLMLLYQSGFEAGRYVSLERIIEESSESYYEALEASSQSWHEAVHNPHPWLEYFWGMLIRAYKEFEERVRAAKPKRGGKTEQVRSVVRSLHQPFSISDVQQACPDVSRDMIRIVLNQMRDEGIIELKGRGRSAVWQHVLTSS